MCAKVVIAGGTGFIGSAVAAELTARGHDVTVLTRGSTTPPSKGIRHVTWMSGQPWHRDLDGSDAVINLAGSTIDCRHTPENLARVLRSRVDSIRAIADAVPRCGNPPRAWVQASAVGFYGNRGDERCDENARRGGGALADLCGKWEAEFAQACPAGVRGVVIRTGVVLGRSGGAHPKLAGLARALLGGRAGSGQQGMSWILLDDIVEVFIRGALDDSMRGIFNGTAPNPVSNDRFMRELRKSVRRPWSPPVPAVAVKLGARLMGTDPSLALEGQYVVPRRLIDAGHAFRSTEIAHALSLLA